MTGRVDVYYSPVLAALPFIKDGKVLPLAVSSPTRAATFPTFRRRSSPAIRIRPTRFWIGVFAPAKTPPDIVNKLNAEIQKALQVPALRERLAKLGVQPMAMNAGAFDKFVKEELTINAELAKAAGLTAH